MSSTIPTVRRKKSAAVRKLRSPSHSSSTDGSQEWTSGCHALADKRLHRERSRSTERLSTLSNISEHEIHYFSKFEDPLEAPQTDAIQFIELSAKKHDQLSARNLRSQEFLTNKLIQLYRDLKRVQKERKQIERAQTRVESRLSRRQMATRSGVQTFNTPLLHLGVNSLQQEGQPEGCSQKWDFCVQEELNTPTLFSEQSFTFKRETPSESQHWDGEEAAIYRGSSRLHAEDQEFIASLARYAPHYGQETPDIY